jgi:hypothetical protein
LTGKSRLPKSWEKEQRAVKAVQIAFDVGAEVQHLIRREAVDQAINPPDRVRQILGLPVSNKPIRPRLSISLSPDDFLLLAQKFGVDPHDHVAIRNLAAQMLIQHLAESKQETSSED